MDPLISRAALDEFRAIWRREFGEDLSPERAKIEAESLVRAVYLIVSAAARIERASQTPSGEIRQVSNQMLPTDR